MSRRLSASALAIFVVLMLAACGGGGGSDGPGPGGSEGTASSPVAVSVGVPHAGYAGIYPSYYYFQASAAGTYTISLTGVNADVSWDLYDSPGFSGFSMANCDDNWSPMDESCSADISTPGLYYIEIINWDAAWGIPQATYFLMVSPPYTGCTGAGCFGFEDGFVPVGFINSAGSDAAWEVDTTNAANGVNSLRSGPIIHGQASCVEYAPSASTSKVSFMLMTDSESAFDNLVFYIDGVWQDEWSGNTSWMGVAFSATSGPHVYKWCYEKDFSVSSGADTVWVDDIKVQ